MADVFISYAQREPEPTVAVADALTKRGFRPWYDVNLLPGAFFGKVIDDAIDRAQAVVTIWSAPALDSQWVPAESARALRQNKLICVRTKDVDPAKLPTPFHQMHVPLWEDIDGLFQALIGLGVRPSGALAAASDIEALTNAAQRDWRAMQQGDVEALEAFLEEYGQLAMYRRMAQKRLDAARAQAPALVTRAPPPAPEPPSVRPEDVILRLDPGMHTAPVRRVAVSADGRLLATASQDKTVKLWALPEGRLLRTLRPPIGPGDEGKVYAAALDPAGRWIAAGGRDKAGEHWIRIFDTETGRVLHRLGPLPNVALDLKVSPDAGSRAGAGGARLAAGLGGNSGVRLWDVRTWALILEDRDYGDGVFGLAFAADGRLAATSFDGDVRLYGADGRRLARAKAPGGAQPFGIAFANDQRTAFGAGEDAIAVGYSDFVRLDLLDGRDLKPLRQADSAGLSGGNLSTVAFFGAGRLAAGGMQTNQGRLFVWDEAGRGARAVWPGPDSTIMDFAVLPDGSLVFGAGDPAFGVLGADGETRLRRGPTTADLRNKRREHFAVSGDGKRLRFGLKPFSDAPVLFDVARRTLSDAPSPSPDLAQAETKALAVAGWENTATPKLAGRALPLEAFEMARGLAIAPDAQSFVLGADWSLRRFNAQGALLWEQPVPGTVWGVNLAREGKLVIAAYGDGTIRWHDAQDGKELLALFIHLPLGPANYKEGDPHEWILFTPEGYFDASSPAAEKLIGWHVNRGPDEAADFYPAATFAAAFKRPDKIDAALDAI